MNALSSAVAAAKTIALTLPVIDPSPVAPPGVSDKANTILGYLMWAGGVAVVASLIIAGIVIALNSHGRAGDHADRIIAVLGGILIAGVIIAGAGAIGSALVPGV
ncbi:hypothetical protein [Actinomyces radicidentis]|uniref:hypothetical protein n=1 Tax=Actinomyces radicidentis TaxID=111015 RepID=UPI0028E24F9F|nr:hypothetical protein [Actinomyces radicidentis]